MVDHAHVDLEHALSDRRETGAPAAYVDDACVRALEARFLESGVELFRCTAVAIVSWLAAPCFQRRQPRLGVGDKLSHTGFGARVLRKSEDRPHPHYAVPKPSLFVLKIGGHKASLSHDRNAQSSRLVISFTQQLLTVVHSPTVWCFYSQTIGRLRSRHSRGEHQAGVSQFGMHSWSHCTMTRDRQITVDRSQCMSPMQILSTIFGQRTRHERATLTGTSGSGRLLIKNNLDITPARGS